MGHEEIPGPVRAMFMGAATVWFSDGQTGLLTDGFFTRPGLLRVIAGRISPDPIKIRAALDRAGITHLDAVLVGHSHFDHALDAPEVARQTGARLVGSSSSANIARGWGLPEVQILAPAADQPLTFGAFRVTFLPSHHSSPLLAPGEITRPFTLPARATTYREGGTYAILIEHPRASILVNESAGFIPGGLAGHQAEVVLLSLGSMGRTSPTEKESYFREVVLAVGARRIYPIHWDNFTRPLTQSLRPMPFYMDHIQAAFEFLQERVKHEKDLQLGTLPPWQFVEL